MCRLFGLSAAPQRVQATFWLIEAPDSLAAQSRYEPDGVGLGVFDLGGTPQVYKRPVAAYEDTEFARNARELRGTTFIAHIRYASTGGLETKNTHPFCQDGRLFAHNGVIEDLPRLEAELGEAGELVNGDTDSERFFALITKYTRNGDDVTTAISRALRWVATNLPVYAVNIVLTTPTDLWALRYPETHELFVLERSAGGQYGNRHLEHASAPGTVRVRSADLSAAPAVVVATERMDEDPGWRPLSPGELLHAGPDLRVESRIVLDEPPKYRLTLADLNPTAAASQSATGGRSVNQG
jgi:glutamine amidotransferase